MAGYPWIVVTFAIILVTNPVSTKYFPNHKYDDETGFTYEQEKQKNELSINYVPSQLRSPLDSEKSVHDTQIKTENVKRNIGLRDEYGSSKETSDMNHRRSYENFVTPKDENVKKGYEVTTKKFKDTPVITPSALEVDHDVAIALDDEDIEQDVQSENSRPEHLNPLVYLDSYGRLHGGEGKVPKQSKGQGFGYGIIHSRVPPHHPHSRKASGRVRMQVFRGPTRKVGHRKYAPWGYFVVQPADNYVPYRYPGPPYIYR